MKLHKHHLSPDLHLLYMGNCSLYFLVIMLYWLVACYLLSCCDSSSECLAWICVGHRCFQSFLTFSFYLEGEYLILMSSLTCSICIWHGYLKKKVKSWSNISGFSKYILSFSIISSILYQTNLWLVWWEFLGSDDFLLSDWF